MFGYYRVLQYLFGSIEHFIVVNAPARSGTSVLTYILCNHPQVRGYGETKITYDSKAEIDQLVRQVCWADRNFWISGKYYLDKAVYNKFIPSISVFDSVNVKWIYILRDPESTLKSFVEYFGKSEQQALEYYRSRLNKLGAQAKQINSKDNSLFVTYEQFTNKTDHTLSVISQFLELDQPLSSTYTRKAATRRYGFGSGDESKSIDAGRILNNVTKRHVQISDEVLLEAKEVYQQCHSALTMCCTVV